MSKKKTIPFPTDHEHLDQDHNDNRDHNHEHDHNHDHEHDHNHDHFHDYSDHNHSHSHGGLERHVHATGNKLKWAFWATLIILAVEVIGGSLATVWRSSVMPDTFSPMSQPWGWPGLPLFRRKNHQPLSIPSVTIGQASWPLWPMP